MRPALGDKFARATPVAAAWNRGDILVRADAAWAESFCDELARFTGQNDPHDDQIDALAAAFDLLAEYSDDGGAQFTSHVAFGDSMAGIM